MILPLTLLTLLIFKNVNGFKSCTTYESYFFSTFSNKCFEDKDILANTTQVLKNHDIPYETHEVTTTDGYILTVFRLTNEAPKGVVVFLHAALSNSIQWVGQRNESLAFYLYREGYEIWLPNQRGTTYSEKHKELDIDDDFSYWDFSFHEVGLFDYDSIFTYIYNITNTKLITISHYSGSTSALVYASLKPDVADNLIKIFITIGAQTYQANVRSPLKYVCRLEPLFKKIFYLLEIGELGRDNSIKAKITHILGLLPFKFAYVLFKCFLFGWTPTQMDPSLVSLLYTQNPSGLSYKTLYHYAQISNSETKDFVMYDYNDQELNQLHYNSSVPNKYPIENIKTPVYIIASQDDSFTTLKDNEILFSKLSPSATRYGNLTLKGFNSFDYIYGKDRIEKMYLPIRNLINNL